MLRSLQWKLAVARAMACALAQSSSVLAAIAVDNTSSGSGAGPSINFSHTIGGGANRLLFVSIAVEDDGADNDIDTVTYNGAALAPAIEHNVGGGIVEQVEIWYALEASLPVAGAYTITISGPGVPNDIIAGAISVTGAAQAGPEATAFNDDAGAPSISQLITTLTDGAYIFDAVGSGNLLTLTANGGQTDFFNTGFGSSTGAGSYEEKTPAGGETQGYGAVLEPARVRTSRVRARAESKNGLLLGGDVGRRPQERLTNGDDRERRCHANDQSAR